MILGISVEIFMCFQLLALGSLKEAAMKIYTELSTGSLNGARKNLTHIVGRDTENLDEKSVIKVLQKIQVMELLHLFFICL